MKTTFSNIWIRPDLELEHPKIVFTTRNIYYSGSCASRWGICTRSRIPASWTADQARGWGPASELMSGSWPGCPLVASCHTKFERSSRKTADRVSNSDLPHGKNEAIISNPFELVTFSLKKICHSFISIRNF